MPDERLTKQVFLWDKLICTKNWSFEVKQILSEVNMLQNFLDNQPVNLSHIQNRLFEADKIKWRSDVTLTPKLRTYIKFKEQFGTEKYVKQVVNRKHRSAIAQLRCGILPLAIETGRYINIPEEFRLCLLCDVNAVESETHFLFHCAKYNDLRDSFYNQMTNTNPDFQTLTDDAKLKIIMSDEIICKTAKFIHDCFELRRTFMYTDQ